MPRGIRNIRPGAETPEQPTRADKVRTERRRKPGSVNGAGLHLSVDESKLDRANYHYRFVNDTPGRIAALYAQDYDVAPEMDAKPDGNGLGTVNSAQAGVIEGRPFGAVLMRKPKHMHEDDQKDKQKPVDEIEKAIRRGNTNHKGNELRGAGVYTPGADESNPSGVNIIERV